MRAVVIVLLEIPADVFSGLTETAIFRRPDFLLFQAAMEPLNLAGTFGMMVGCATVRDTELRKGLHKPRRGKLRAIVGG